MDKDYNILFRYAYNNQSVPDEDKKIIASLIEREGMDKVIAYIKKRKFVPFVADLLIRLGYDEPELFELRTYYSDRNANVIKRLDELFQSFIAFGATHVVVVENFGAFLSQGADPIWRFGSGDVDLYGDISQKEQMYAAAEALGYKCIERYSGNNLISVKFDNMGIFPDGFYFDLGWTPTARLKIPFLQYKEEVVDWNSVRKYKDTSIQLPDIESLLYICMMHISVHGFSRQPDIRLYIDIQNCCHNEINWEKIISWAERDGFKNRIATAGYLAKQLLGCPIPDEIINLCHNQNHKRLLGYVYDKDGNYLIDRASASESVKVEMYADDDSAFKGLLSLTFPPKKWLTDTFGSNVLLSECEYIIKLFR